MHRIETILNERGLTKAAFAELMGTSRQNVNSLLKNPTASKLQDIAQALDIPLWQLFITPAEARGEKQEDFVAMIRRNGKFHHADSIDQLKALIAEWEGDADKA